MYSLVQVTGLRGFVGFMIFVAMSKLTLSTQAPPASLVTSSADLGEALLDMDEKEDDQRLTRRLSVSLSQNWMLEFDDDSIHVTHLLRHDLVL